MIDVGGQGYGAETTTVLCSHSHSEAEELIAEATKLLEAHEAAFPRQSGCRDPLPTQAVEGLMKVGQQPLLSAHSLDDNTEGEKVVL